MANKVYACIDLKSFYASVEARLMGFDPNKINLVVADASKGEGAITLAITPALKKLGVRNRCRLFEIPKHIKYIAVKPKMKRYMEVSASIYAIYLKYVAKQDIHVYSIDECFLDITGYLRYYQKNPVDFVKMIVDDIYQSTGIQAAAGIGDNLFLAKVALDIISKKVDNLIAYIDWDVFNREIRTHRPITDVWGIGHGIAKRLAHYSVYDLAGIAKLDPGILYREFGIQAEILIDHANGVEPCTIADIHSYESKSNSISTSQILFEDYQYQDAWVVLQEMIGVLCLELVEYRYKTGNISLSIGYSKDCAKATHVSKTLVHATDSYRELTDIYKTLYFRHVKQSHPIRKIGLSLNHLHLSLVDEISLFEDGEFQIKERKVQQAMNQIKQKYGKNSILRAISLDDKATLKRRNQLIGGHNAE